MRIALIVSLVAALATATAAGSASLPASNCTVSTTASKAFPGAFHFTMRGCKSMATLDISATDAIKLSTAWAVMTQKTERGVGAILIKNGKEHVLFRPVTAPGDLLYVDMNGLKVGDTVTFTPKGAVGTKLAPFTYLIK